MCPREVDDDDDDEDKDDDLKEYQLDKYDENEEDEGAPMSMFGNAKALAYHESNDDDPYITLPKVRILCVLSKYNH